MKRKSKSPHTAKPDKKKYSFPVPIPPCSVLSVRPNARGRLAHVVGRIFRVGYYGKMDGLDCIWLVDEEGKYSQTIDHEFLNECFDIKSIAKKRSLYGPGRPQFPPMK